MKIGILRTPFDANASADKKISLWGENTGNMVFGHSLDRVLQTVQIPYTAMNQDYDFEQFDAVVITDLIWIREDSNFEYLNKALDKIQKPLIPISVGLQAHSTDSEFKINDSTLHILKRIEDRAVIGVRGDYTAKILKKHGVRKLAVIGCPSMYYWNNPELKIESNVEHPQKILSNFRTIYGMLSQKEKHFLSYSANLKAKFIEQTRHVLRAENVNDERYFSYVSQWLEENKSLYFTVDDWMNDTCEYDFSIGGRFHGNVISLWNNIKSLFLYVDSRTKELTDHFNLPAMDIRDFDKEKPIEYYYEKADYRTFNKNYKQRFNEFKEFLHANHLEISPEVSVKQFAQTPEEKQRYVAERLNRLSGSTADDIVNSTLAGADHLDPNTKKELRRILLEALAILDRE